MENLYADIIVPLALGPLTFAIPTERSEDFEVGWGVEVPVGTKIYTGIIKRIHTTKPPYKKIREVMGVVRSEPLASVEQLALWEWIASYYMCTEGEVMRAAIPSLLKPSAGTDDDFAERVFSLGQVQWLSIAPNLREEHKLSTALDALLPRRKARYAAMVEFLEAVGEGGLDTEIPRKALSAATPIINHLIEDGLLVSTLRERTPQYYLASLRRLRTLSEAQQQALDKLHSELDRRNTTLLHGITGSGKTELYISLAAEMLAEGRSVLYLVPELALSEHLIGRLSEAFDEGLVVYHSQLTPRARTEAYIKLSRSNGGYIIVGTRSAILLPLVNLGLIIVDEEHDRSYKQEDSAPRFSARDTAVWIAGNLGAKTILGSATPSLERFHNAYMGKYGYVTLARGMVVGSCHKYTSPTPYAAPSEESARDTSTRSCMTT